MNNQNGGLGGGPLARRDAHPEMKRRRERRLERKVLVAKLKLVMAGEATMDEDVQACLATLREGLGAVGGISVKMSGVDAEGEPGELTAGAPDYRERRLSAEALVDFYLKTAQLKARDETAAVRIDHLGDRTVQIFDRDGMLAALRDGKFRVQALEPPETGKNGEAGDE